MNIAFTAILAAALLSAALLAATITDLRSQRIPNLITFPLVFAGLILHSVAGGLDGFLHSLQGLGVGFGVLFIPYIFGIMGAGDVKLMAGVGAFLGPADAFTAFLFTCLAGGVYAIVVLLMHRGHASAVFANIKHTFFQFFTTRQFEFTPAAPGTLPRLCYGLAIAVGTVAAVVVTWLETGIYLAGLQ